MRTSAQVHRHALHLECVCKERDELIARQQSAIDYPHRAVKSLQSIIVRQRQTSTEQKKTIAEQDETIAALQAHITKLVSANHDAECNAPTLSRQFKVSNTARVYTCCNKTARIACPTATLMISVVLLL